MSAPHGITAVVTGAASGIGRAVTQRLRNEGNRVAACDIAPRIADTPDGHVLDVADAAAVDATIERIENDIGEISVLVNAAGVLQPASILDMHDADWNAMVAVNTTGVLNMMRAVARHMAPRRTGSIVTVSSNAGGVPRQKIGGYAATKAAATHLTRCMGLELAPLGIRCNIVAPGSTDTPMLRRLWGVEAIDPTEVSAGDPSGFRVGIPLGTVADPDDVAACVCFLASDDASQLTLQELYVDGGAALR